MTPLNKTIYERIRIRQDRKYMYECPCGYKSRIFHTKKKLSLSINHHIINHCPKRVSTDMTRYIIYGNTPKNNVIYFTFSQWYHFTTDTSYQKIINEILDFHAN